MNSTPYTVKGYHQTFHEFYLWATFALLEDAIEYAKRAQNKAAHNVTVIVTCKPSTMADYRKFTAAMKQQPDLGWITTGKYDNGNVVF